MVRVDRRVRQVVGHVAAAARVDAEVVFEDEVGHLEEVVVAEQPVGEQAQARLCRGIAQHTQLVEPGQAERGLLQRVAEPGQVPQQAAVFASNDEMAYGVMLALYKRGLRVPEDVPVVGFDDKRGASYTTPPLTTVRQPTEEMGRAAAEGVLRLLRGAPLDLPALSTGLAGGHAEAGAPCAFDGVPGGA
jgi:hypothetical protein